MIAHDKFIEDNIEVLDILGLIFNQFHMLGIGVLSRHKGNGRNINILGDTNLHMG